MTLPRRPPDPQSVGWFNLVLALLDFVIAGLVLYFRLGPVQRVLDRLVRDGVRVPAWLPLVFTAGTVVAVAWLAARGVQAVRRALEDRDRPPGSR